LQAILLCLWSTKTRIVSNDTLRHGNAIGILLVVGALQSHTTTGCGIHPQGGTGGSPDTMACATPEQPAGIAQTTTTAIPATAPKPIIQVIPYKGAVKDRVIFTEEISQNNCGNSRDLPHSVDRSQTVAYTLEVGGGVTVNVDGTISAGLPGDLADIEVSVGAEVAAQYGVSYGKEETFSKSLTVVTEAGSNRQFTIRHIELWETGELVITIGEWQQRYPYKFRRGFGLEQVDSRDLGCPTPTVEPTGTPPPEPPLTPTRRPPTTTPTPTLPPEESGWHLYDDFTAPDALDTNWWLNDENQICTLNVSEGQLSFDTRLSPGTRHGCR